MANWILAQQIVLSISLLLLLLLEKKAMTKLGANYLYLLWLLVPLGLFANNLPSQLRQLGHSGIYQYLVKFNQQSSHIAANLSWHWLWWIGTFSVVSMAIYSQWKIYTLPRCTYNKNLLPLTLPNRLQVAESTCFNSPVLAGLLRPILLLPVGFQQQFSHQQQQLIIEHELVHFRRADNLFNGIAVLIVALFWFNPLVWLAYRAFRRSQELACDAKVLKNKNKSEKIAYCKALLLCAQHPSTPLSLYSQYGEKHSMHLRIQSIKNNLIFKPSAIALTLVLSTGLLSGVVFANQQATTPTMAKLDEASPITRVEPKYPVEAARKQQEGSVILQFNIGKDGSTDNIKVIKAEPEVIFDKVSIAALQQWKYKPRIVGGVAQVQNNLLVQLDFRMDDSPKEIQPLIEGIKVIM